MKKHSSVLKAALSLFAISFCFFASPLAKGKDIVTWDLNPVDGNWETPDNWNTGTLPTDFAAFGASNITDITLPHGYDLTPIIFNPGASSFSFELEFDYDDYFYFTSKGVQNNSGVTQYFYNNSLLEFDNQSNAGSNVVYTNVGNEAANYIAFENTANAGSATIINNGPAISAGESSGVIFGEKSSAGSSTITNTGGGEAAITTFFTQSTAGQSTIVCNPGGFVIFEDESTAGNSIITATTGGVRIDFDDTSTAGAATLMAIDGGAIDFNDSSTGGTAQVKLVGGGLVVALKKHRIPFVIGSLQGSRSPDGAMPAVDTNSFLQIGSNGVDTTYAGQFVSTTSDGTLTKIGAGTLTLKQDSPSLNGAVTVTGGTLVAANTTGSATGTGDVFVNAGTLGGSGIVGGSVTIGTGTGSGAFLAPAAGGVVKSLTVNGALTFDSDGTFNCLFQSRNKKTKSDQVTANGMTIQAGAQFVVTATGTGGVGKPGTSFTVIDNVASTPINGTFANLPDGATITINGASLQANYEGGDGNDLTLTVQ